MLVILMSGLLSLTGSAGTLAAEAAEVCCCLALPEGAPPLGQLPFEEEEICFALRLLDRSSEDFQLYWSREPELE